MPRCGLGAESGLVIFHSISLGSVLANGTVVTDRAADPVEEGMFESLSITLALTLDAAGADATSLARATKRMREDGIEEIICWSVSVKTWPLYRQRPSASQDNNA